MITEAYLDSISCKGKLLNLVSLINLFETLYPRLNIDSIKTEKIVELFFFLSNNLFSWSTISTIFALEYTYTKIWQVILLHSTINSIVDEAGAPATHNVTNVFLIKL